MEEREGRRMKRGTRGARRDFTIGLWKLQPAAVESSSSIHHRSLIVDLIDRRVDYRDEIGNDGEFIRRNNPR